MAKTRAKEHMKQLKKSWHLSADAKELWCEMKLKDFVSVIALVNKIATLAESEGHHPDLNIFGWNRLRITLSTHAINGLSVNDFIMAAKIDHL